MVALDSFPPELLHRWCDEGVLPNIRALRDQSTSGAVDSVAKYLPGAVWPTFASGQDPSHHAHMEFMSWDPAGMGCRRPGADWMSFECFWHRLARQGIPAMAFDVPYTEDPGGDLPLVEVHGWGLHDELAPAYSRPARLVGALRRRFGPSPVKPDVLGPKKPATLRKELDDLLVSLERRVSIIELLAHRFPWRVFVTTVAETHRAGHWYWTERSTGTPLEGVQRVAQAIDTAIPRLRALVGPDDHFALFSLHGMGPSIDIDRYHEPLWDYFEPGGQGRRRRFDPVRVVNRALPPYLRRRVSAMFPTQVRDRLLAHSLATGRDWSKIRTIMSIPDGRLYLRANLQGRERDGVVLPADAPEHLDWVASTILSARNATGEPVFRAVDRPAQFWSGPRLDLLPDLIAQVHQRPTGDAITMPDGVAVRAPWRGWRDGDHRPEGFYIQVGPGVRGAATGPTVTDQGLAAHLLAPAGIAFG